jgi:hypothetical protein
MCERGTEVALFDYADNAEKLLGVRAFVLYDINAPHNFEGAVAKFRRRFGDRLLGLHGWSQVDPFLKQNSIQHLYQICCNNDREKCSRLPHVRNYIHAVFEAGDPYGDVYAKISPCVPGACPVVPHIVRAATDETDDLRAELGIPPDATVFGRYGGYESFDIDAARAAVLELARACECSSGSQKLFFLFMNTPPLAPPLRHIIHLERTSDECRKRRFIRTCDAMIHARSAGETFGLAVAEFSACNKPVFTSKLHTDDNTARFHLDTLSRHSPLCKELFYTDKAQLVGLFRSFDREKAKRVDWNAYRAFEPAHVMAIFHSTFLNGRARKQLPEWKQWRRGGDRARRTASRPSAEEYARAKAEWQENWRVRELLSALRGLPREVEGPHSQHYRVVATAVPLRLAPSLSAAQVGMLDLGVVITASAKRGPWIGLGREQTSMSTSSHLELDLAAGAAEPVWLLSHHPEDGDQVELIPSS